MYFLTKSFWIKSNYEMTMFYPSDSCIFSTTCHHTFVRVRIILSIGNMKRINMKLSTNVANPTVSVSSTFVHDISHTMSEHWFGLSHLRLHIHVCVCVKERCCVQKTSTHTKKKSKFFFFWVWNWWKGEKKLQAVSIVRSSLADKWWVFWKIMVFLRNVLAHTANIHWKINRK